MNRRDFLLLKAPSATQPAMLSCETLYMRFLDARVAGTTTRLFDVLREDLANTSAVTLTEASWLSDVSLKENLDIVLNEFRERGGRVA